MIAIPRGPCRAFPALARKCVSGRPRGPAPVVVCEAQGGTLTVWERTDAVLLYTAPTSSIDELVVVPMAVLEAAADSRSEVVELVVGSKPTGEARFTDRGGPKCHPFEVLLPGKQHRLPDPPDEWHAVPVAFLAALHECGRTTAKDATRFALTRVQVKGTAGQVVATDGRTALLRGGFTFPFADDLLVPALPVFGSRELAAESLVRVGRTATHLVVGAGPWRVYLPLDRSGRYPDVAGVVPRHAPTAITVADRDAAVLLEKVPGMPGGDADHRPVTLAIDRDGVVVRAGDAKLDAVKAVWLRRSTATGPGVRAAIDRRVLLRALALGCRTARLAPDKPVVFEGDDTTVLTVALDPALAVGPVPDCDTTDSNHNPEPVERRTAMRHETNGSPPNGRHDPPEAADPLAAAEELRTALGDALTAASRLVAVLKHQKKEKKALASVYAGLKALNLGPGGQP